MKMSFVFLAVMWMLMTAMPAIACHPDRHFGTVVAIDESAQRFAVIHLGSHPDMGGKYFVFSADRTLIQGLKLGANVAIDFIADQEQLIAKETEEFKVS